MATPKQQKHFERVNTYKERFRKLPSDTLRKRLALGYPLIEEAAIAIREILEERGERDPISN